MHRYLLALILALGPAGLAYAACPSGQVLKPIGSGVGARAVVSSTGQDVAFVSGVCTSTACTVTLYDDDSITVNDAVGGAADITDADVRFETGAAASTAFVHDLTDSPVRFSSGVVVEPGGTDNLQGVVLLSCQAR